MNDENIDLSDMSLRKWSIVKLLDKGIIDDSLIPFANQIVEFIKEGKVPEIPPVEDEDFGTVAFPGDDEESDDEWLKRARAAVTEK